MPKFLVLLLCTQRVSKLDMKRDFNYKKATQMLNFFAEKEGGSINKMKSLKLLWLADRLHLRLYGRLMSNDTYVAMKFGPVASNTKDIAENSDFCSEEEREYSSRYIMLSGANNHFIRSMDGADAKVFSKTDMTVLENIYQAFGAKTQFELSEISHVYPEWKRWESQLQNKGASRFPMDILDFFENPDSNNHPLFEEDEEGIFLAKALFTENEHSYFE